MEVSIGYVFAAIVVVVYAIRRFNTPAAVKSQTTRIQYYGSCTFYVLSCLGLFMLTEALVSRYPDAVTFLTFGAVSIPDGVKGLQGPFLAALLLTVLLPNLPLLREIDAFILHVFHKLGQIPISAMRWVQRMNNAQFTVTPTSLDTIETYIHGEAAIPDEMIRELRIAASDGVRYRFTRSLALYVALQNQEGLPRFRSSFADEVAEFEKKMAALFSQCVGFFALTGKLSYRELKSDPGALAQFRAWTIQIENETKLMLSRVLLYSSSSDASVSMQLRNIGFSVEVQRPIRIPKNLLALDMAGVVVLFIAATVFFGSGPNMNIGKAIMIGMLVACNHCLAVVCALLPKQVWSNATPVDGERPYLAYLFSGACTLTVTAPVSGALYLFRTSGVIDSGPILNFPAQCKWLVLSMVMGIALAAFCDNLAGRREPRWLRYAESFALAGIMACAGYLVKSWLHADQIALHSGGPIPSLWPAVWLSAAIGALFGGTIPHWHRAMLRSSATPAAGARAGAPVPSHAAVTPAE